MPKHWTLVIPTLAVASLLVLAPARVAAQDAAGPSSAAAMKADLLHWVADAESKLNQLAGAMPAAKYSWRPGKGVRSVGEVYMHVASANYGVPALWGAAPPAGFNPATYERSLSAKADVQKALRESFVSLKEKIGALSDADFEKPVNLFGSPSTVRGACFLLLSHSHEHLGQSIAYARTNGVVPPWSLKSAAAAKPTP
jgi:uncharacterized damage-inducible protein DinB